VVDESYVSVIIPTYNRASLIGAAIQSVLDQTYKSVEIIVVDDGSTDETQRALEPYAGKIVSLVTANKGPGHARNVGMKAASGKYIAFLDSDDMYLPHKLELQVAFMEKNPHIGMVSTNMSAMREGEIVEEYHLNRYHRPIFHDYSWTLEDIYPVHGAFEFLGESIPSYTGDIFKYMLHWPALFSNSVLFSRKILEIVGYQNEAYQLGEDYDYTVRICKRFKVACLDIPTYVLRYGEDQITMVGNQWSRERHATWIRILETIIQVALDHGRADTDYYSQNKVWLDPLLSKKYLELGRKLIDYGDAKKARECFLKAYDYDPSDEAFFCKMLGDVDEPMAPFGLVDVQCDRSGIAEACYPVDSTLARRLREQARAFGVSVANVCHLAWALVLARVSGRDDVVFGTVLFGPMQGGESADRVSGPFINTLPVRIRVSEEGVQDTVRNMHEMLSQLLYHKHTSLALAQSCSAVAAPAPLFSALLHYRQSGAVAQQLTETDQAKASTVFLGGEERSNFPLILSIHDQGENFALTTRVQSPVDPRRICAYLYTALEQLVEALESQPATSVRSLDVLPEAERRQVLVEWNDTKADYPKDKCVHELFEDQVKKSPDAVAVVLGAQQLSYWELNQRANQLAHYLRKLGVGPEVLVAVCLARSLDMVVGILGILKAGGAYVPLDAAYPNERLAFMLEDTQALVLLTQSQLLSRLPEMSSDGRPATNDGRERSPVVGLRSIICLDRDWEEIAKEPEHNVENETTAENLAYVIYTSGSTGKPKGVEVPHRGVVRLLFGVDYARFDAARTFLQLAPISFDAATFELWGALLHGARCVVYPDKIPSPNELGEVLHSHKVTTLWLTSSLFNAVIDEAPEALFGIRQLLIGGETLSVPHVRKALSQLPETEIINGYGPTESTTFTCCYPIPRELNGAISSIPIGRPIGNTQVYLLDTHLQPVPIGVPGELYIGGDGLARGYLNRPELTRDRFIRNPFSEGAKSRLYKTGDLARYLADGNIEFLGRIDNQVKIHGYRIELGEIETVLGQHPAVQEAVVIAREESDNPKSETANSEIPNPKSAIGNSQSLGRQLVAYCVARQEQAIMSTELRSYLKSKLPDYMIPSVFMLLDSLPLSPNGKIDRKALPVPERSGREATYVAPRTATEEILARIWAEVLGLDRVGIHDNFFELGGHSLLAMLLMARVRRIGLQAEARNLFLTPTIAELAEAIGGDSRSVEVPPNLIPAECQAISPDMLPLVQLSPGEIERLVAAVPGGAANIQDIYPLAPLQEGFLFHHRLASKGDAYFLTTLISFDSRDLLDRYLLALQAVIDRHDILRTAVFWEGLIEPVQVVHRHAPLIIEELSLNPVDGDIDQQLRARFDQGHYRLDVRQAPMMRIFVADDAINSRWLMLNLSHHLVTDHTTLERIEEEIQAHLTGQADRLPAPLPFRNLVAQERLGVSPEEHEAFFRTMLADVNEPTAPFGLTDVRGDGSKIQEAYYELDSALAKRLREAVRGRGVSAASLFHLAWARVLAQCSGRDDVVFGTILLGRMQGGEGFDRVMGPFINTLPVRIRVSDKPVSDALKCTHSLLARLLRHEHARLAAVQRCSGVIAPAPLFTSILNYRHSAGMQRTPAAKADGERVLFPQVMSGIEMLYQGHYIDYPLLLAVDDLGEGFSLQAQVQLPVDPKRVCAYMNTALEQLIGALEISPAVPLRSLNVVPEAERHQVLVEWNDTTRDYEREGRLHRLIEQQVATTPDAVALEFEGRTLTYAELNQRANQLGRLLRRKGVGPDVLVGVFAERSFEMVVALLAVLKAGGAYVPLDPSYPAERLGHMLDDARISLVLSQAHLASQLPPQAREVHLLDGSWAVYATESREDLEDIGTPQDLAYVIFTSGSTGRPKGAMNEHRGICNRLLWMQEEYGLTHEDRVLQKTQFSFDVSTWEFFWPLLAGARLVIARPDGQRDSAYLVRLIQERGITTLHFVPSMLRVFLEQEGLEACGSLKRVICSGEALPHELQERFFARLPSVALHNLYGPTEAAVDVTYWVCERGDERLTVPIGRPVANTQIYVLDARMRPAPVGVAGELYIGGVQVGRGYVGRDDLTAERFVPDPFSKISGARLYKTGDLARHLPDGAIEYLGRLDYQVKIRGQRIELGEIEATLDKHAGVGQSVVMAREDTPGDQRLVAYIVPRQAAPSIEELKEHLSRELPAYMVPSAFVFLEALPLTSSGKVDRKLLPRPDKTSYAPQKGHVAPRTLVEAVLAAIWAEELKFESIGVHDNFFELGGHSLLATRVAFRVHATFQIEMSLRTFFDAPTVAGMAAVICQLQSENGGQGKCEDYISECDRFSRAFGALPVIVPKPDERYIPFPLTDVQQAYWLGRTPNFALGNVASHYYQELVCAGLDLARFNRAWQRLIERHDMLRAIVLPDGQQQILTEVPPYEIEILDLRGQDSDTKAKQLTALRRRMSHQVLPSDRWPLFEVRASLLDDELVRLHMSTDALILDAWSGSIIARELVRLYQTPDANLEPLDISFRDYVLADLALRDSGLYRRSKDYWWSRLPTLPPAPEVPLAKDPSSITMPRFVGRSARLEPDLWSQLKSRATRVGGLTASGLLLAAFAEVLKVWSKITRFTINLTVFNRLPLHPQINNVVGDFTSLVLLAVDCSEGNTFEGRARRLQQQLWQDLDHGYVSGLKVMRELAREQGGIQGGMMPVVFTSALGQEIELLDQLGPVVYSISQTPQVWLDHVVFEVEGALNFNWYVVEELFPEGLLDDMFDSYCRFLRRLADDEHAWQETWPETARKLLPVRQLEQRAEVNDTGAPITDDLLHTLFAKQVGQRPQQPAVISSSRTLTYEELYRRANQISHWLRRNGAQRNSLVAVVMEKGWEQVAAVLGVLGSGAAYLPMDAGAPKHRLWHLLQHGKVQCVLTQPWLEQKLEWPEGIKRLCVSDVALFGINDDPLQSIQTPEDLAYVIYTSGSTGLPKGVAIDHRGAVNTILDINRRFGVKSEDRVLALSSLNFDLSVYDIFGTLAAGGVVVIPDGAHLRDPAHWADLVARHRVTLWNSVPALMQMLVEYLKGHGQRLPLSLRLIFMSGDWIPVRLPDQIRALADSLEIISMGGATEASIWSIIYPIDKVDPAWKSIPYGRPMVNQSFHVLNDALEPCPVWVPGQLYIGGIGLARGYWRDEERTRESFINHPRAGERLYRTGDLGRYLPDGNIEFLGREDFQVKVQGYRVELGEIEIVLAQHPKVGSSIVTAMGQAFGAKRLVAYVVSKEDPPPLISELAAFLRERLPQYMLPSAYVILDHLPLSSNGKVDRRALPEPAPCNGESIENSITETTNQTRIASLVADVLKINHIDPEENLLNLGATSIDVVRIANLIERELDFRPKIDVFYRLPTVAALTSSYEQHLVQLEKTAGLMLNVAQLSEDEVESMLGEMTSLDGREKRP
jgi:amino acid adenylation domain-containing protein